MKTNFAPRFFRELDPVSGVVGGIGMLAGLGQAIFSGRKKAERELNKQIDKSPKYTANKSILDYYNKALSRYSVNPTDSAMYKSQMQGIDRGLSGGVNALQDRRSATAGLSSILRASNDAKLSANVAAEQEKNNRFSVLGGATQLKANEDDKAFQQNEVVPFELRTNMAAQKLQAANQRANAGMQNIFGGLQTAAAGYTKGKK